MSHFTCMGAWGIVPSFAALLIVPQAHTFYIKTMIANINNFGVINYYETNSSKQEPTQKAEPACEDVTPDTSSSVSPESYSGNSRGRKTQRLFVDEQTAEQEKTRLLNFLHLHNLGSREFDSSEDSSVNQIAVCFYRQWAKRNLLDEKAGSTAYVRFLKNECELPISVLEKALANVLSRMIFGDDRYPNWSGEISAYFPN